MAILYLIVYRLFLKYRVFIERQKMRIWDISPGYLNRNSLLGEHRELHAIVSIILNNKKGYSKHPETMRWTEFGWALKKRHDLLSAEMFLRGYNDRTPVVFSTNEGKWPEIYIDSPYEQLNILKKKYIDKEPGRIHFPKSAQELWSHHKYSIMARSVKLYEEIGKSAADRRSGGDYSELAKQLTETLRLKPSAGGLINAIQHMWGYVSECDKVKPTDIENWSAEILLKEIQRRVLLYREKYLMNSTALSELKAWIF